MCVRACVCVCLSLYLSVRVCVCARQFTVHDSWQLIFYSVSLPCNLCTLKSIEPVQPMLPKDLVFCHLTQSAFQHLGGLH